MSNITIKDIARELNLSTSTVSRALRDSYEISTETKEKVLAYAKKMHYTPNPIALSLKENKSHSICIIVPEIANNFFSEVINGIDFTAYEKGYNVFIFQTHESYEREMANLESGLSRRVDGIIMSLSGTTSEFDYFEKLVEDQTPIVFFDRVPDAPDFHKVVADNFGGAYKGTSYLLKQGKRKIAHVTSPPVLSITRERLDGYKTCLKDHDIPVNESLIKYCGFDPMEAHKTIEALIKEHQPDSFIIGSDRLALHSLEAIKKFQGALSHDIEIVGFTNVKHASLFHPPIHTIRQPAFEMGQQAVNLLIDCMEQKNKIKEPQKIVLSTELVVQEK